MLRTFNLPSNRICTMAVQTPSPKEKNPVNYTNTSICLTFVIYPAIVVPIHQCDRANVTQQKPEHIIPPQQADKKISSWKELWQRWAVKDACDGLRPRPRGKQQAETTCCPNPSSSVGQSNCFLYPWLKKNTRFSKTPYTWLNPKPTPCGGLSTTPYQVRLTLKLLAGRRGKGLQNTKKTHFFFNMGIKNMEAGRWEAGICEMRSKQTEAVNSPSIRPA